MTMHPFPSRNDSEPADLIWNSRPMAGRPAWQDVSGHAPLFRRRGGQALVIALLGMAGVCFGVSNAESAQPAKGEMLYNGIVLPEVWPPRDRDPASRTPMPVPYLAARPAVVPIDTGRQLFIDDFLVEKTTLRRTFHTPQKFAGNPILKPKNSYELHGGHRPAAAPHSGGAWYDHRDQLFKMWYMTGWYGGAALAHSRDGLTWTRPDLGIVPGTNHIPDPNPEMRWGMDHVRIDWWARNEDERFKRLHFYHKTDKGEGGRVHFSRDGVHWTASVAATGPSGDRNTFFYNPFRKRWVFSIKVQATDASKSRARNYWEHADFLSAVRWKKDDPVFWMGADDLDPPDPAVGDPAQIYDLDVAPYESLLVGIFQVHKGPANSIAEKNRVPKMTELSIGYTRDGFHWHRPVRTPFIAASRKPGDWERAYVHSTGGVLLVVGDKLHIYYSGLSGDAPNGPDMYAGGSTGVAFLRRDGFASMDAGDTEGGLTTRPLRFSGAHLFVNVEAPQGAVRAEVIDAAGKPIPPFTLQNSVAFTGDSTRQRLQWRGADSLAPLAGKEVRVRFQLRNGKLFSFWVTPDAEGFSRGYVAAGGPGLRGPVDSSTGF